MRPRLTERTAGGVTLLGDWRRPGGVAFAFTGRRGGVSRPPFESLNLGSHVGDDPAAVAENRSRALAALGMGPWEGNLVVPNQVHGSHVCVVRSADAAELARVRTEAAEGADAVVCVAAGVPALMCFADCVPVVLVAPGGYALAHSGWRGTIAGVAARALDALLAGTGADVSQTLAYIGPHIRGTDYEVSPELLERFVGEFGERVRAGEGRLALAEGVRCALERAGMRPDQVAESDVSCPRATDGWFSYRAEGGRCGRHGAVAMLVPDEGPRG